MQARARFLLGSAAGSPALRERSEPACRRPRDPYEGVPPQAIPELERKRLADEELLRFDASYGLCVRSFGVLALLTLLAALADNSTAFGWAVLGTCLSVVVAVRVFVQGMADAGKVHAAQLCYSRAHVLLTAVGIAVSWYAQAWHRVLRAEDDVGLACAALVWFIGKSYERVVGVTLAHRRANSLILLVGLAAVPAWSASGKLYRGLECAVCAVALLGGACVGDRYDRQLMELYRATGADVRVGARRRATPRRPSPEPHEPRWRWPT